MSDSSSFEVYQQLAHDLSLSQHTTSSLLDLEPLSDSSSLSSVSTSAYATSPNRDHFFAPLREPMEQQIRHRDTVIASIRSHRNEELTGLSQKLEQTLREIDAMKVAFQEKTKKMEERYQQEKKQIEAESKKEIKRLKTINQQQRDSLAFSKLPKLSQSEYDSLSTQPQSSLTLQQFLAIQLYEYNRQNAIQTNLVEKEKASLTTNCDKLQIQVNQLSAELQSERELRLSLETKLASASRRGISPQPIQMSSNDGEKVKKLESERAELRGAYQVALARLNEATEQRDQKESKIEALQVELGKARTQVTSLTAQVQSFETLNKTQQGIINQQTTDIQELKRIRDEYFTKMIKSSEMRQAEFSNALESHAARLSEGQKSQFDHVQQVTQKMYENEIKRANQATERAIEEAKSLKLEYRKAEEARSKLQAEFVTIQLSHEAENTRISAELKMKTDQYEKLSFNYEQLKGDYENLQDIRDGLTAKFDIVKEELLKLQHEVQLRDERLKQAEEKVKRYEELENQIDQVVETSGLGGLSLALPSDASRRMQQTVMVTKQCMQLKQANQNLQGEIDGLKKQLNDAEERYKSAESQLMASGQPQQVFAQLLSEAKEENAKLKKKVASLIEVNEELQKEIDSLRKESKFSYIQKSEKEEAIKSAQCVFAKSAPQNDTRRQPMSRTFVITRDD